MNKAEENEYLTSQQLLSIVEWLVSKDESENPELNAIYRMVHSHRAINCCKNPHPDWRKEAIDLYSELLKLGEI